jgi:hypothetical protein
MNLTPSDVGYYESLPGEVMTPPPFLCDTHDIILR